MALYHFHVTQVSRGAGQSSVASASYRAGEKLHDSYYGETHDYTRKGGVIMSEIILPDKAPERFSDREILWNEVEHVEKHPQAQLAYSFDFALQNELSREENIRIAREFIMENFVSRGMICDVAIHEPGKDPDDIPNPHVHVLVPMRPLNDDGTWGTKEHREYILDEDGNRIRGDDGKYKFNAIRNTDWGDSETLDHWRAEWARKVNETFELHGIEARVDHRSYIDQGLDLLPQVHEGPNVRAMEAKGIRTEKGEWNRFVKAINKAIGKILGTFKAVIEAIDEIKREEEQLKAQGKAERKDFMDAIEEYRHDLQEKYDFGKSRMVSKKMLELYSFISVSDIRSLDELGDFAKVMYDKVYGIRHETRAYQDKVKEIDRVLDLVSKYKANRPVYETWYKIPKPKKKQEYQNAHDGELRIYHMADRELRKIYPDMKIPVKELLRQRESYVLKAREASRNLEHYDKAAKQAYALKKQVYEAHRERKLQRTQERSL